MAYIIAAFTAGVLIALAVLIVFGIGKEKDDMMQDEYYGQSEKEIKDKKYRHLR